MEHTSIRAGDPASAGGALPGSGRASFGQASISAMSMRWSALHDAAAAVAALAGVQAPTMSAPLRNYPAVIRDIGGWRRAQAEAGIEDLAAIMEPGLSALLAVHARGGSAAAPAAALWEEFCRARDAIVGLLPPQATSGARRST